MNANAAWPPLEPAPSPPPDPMRLPLLALGTHAGVKWYAQRLPCGAVIVTVSGHLGDVHVFNQVEVASVTPAQVRAIVDAEVAEVTKRAAKRRSKR